MVKLIFGLDANRPLHLTLSRANSAGERHVMLVHVMVITDTVSKLA